MKTGARIAVGVGIGYLLGRTKKMRLALMLGAAGAAGRSGTSPGALLRGGLKQLSSVPEIGKLTEIARDELLSAAKSAAVSAASQRIDVLSERIQEGGHKKKKESTEDSDAADEADDDRLEDDEEPDEDAEDTEDAEAEDEAEEPDDEEPERPKRRRSASRRSATAGSSDDSDDDSDDGTARPRRSRAKSSRSPVRRGSGR